MKHAPTSTLLRGFLVLSLSVGLAGKASAQVGTNYGFLATTGTYTDLGGSNDLNSLEVNDAVSGSINIGFSFVFDGVTYTQCRASSNGWLSLGTTASTSLPVNNLSAGTPGRPFLAPLWDDLSGVGGIFGIGQGTAKYLTSGTAPNRVFAMEWRGWKWDRTMGNFTNTISFQCKLYETTNIIEFVYAQEASTPANTSGGASIGICGTGTGSGNFLSLNNTGANPTASGTVETSNLSGRPATGQVYRFLPCVPAQATVNTAVNCGTNTYVATVTVTALGSAPSVDLVSSVTGLFADNVGAGSYNAPPIAAGTAQVITVVHNGNSICNTTTSVTSMLCIGNGTCETPGPGIPDNGCGAGNNMEAGIQISGQPALLNTSVFFESVDLIVSHTYRGDLNIYLMSPTGQLRNLFLRRPTTSASGNNLGNPGSCPSAVLKLKDGAPALSTLNANTDNAAVGTFAPEQTLAGFTGDPNGTWRIRICDAAGTDVGNLRYVKLNFLDCTAPIATATVVEDCANGVFHVNVNVTGTGSGSSVDLFSSLLGVEHNDVGVGSYQLGPFPTGTAVSIAVRHATNSGCDVSFNNLRDCCAGVCSSAFTAVIGNNTTPPVNCGDGASTGGGTRDARWFKWTAPYTGTINVLSCSQSPTVDTYLRLHSGACGGLTFLQQDDDGCGTFAAGSRILNRPVTAGTTYYIEWDNRYSSNGFTWQLQFTATGSTAICTPLAIACGASVNVNSTSGAPNTLPPSACNFNGSSSTGGTHWWKYTALADGEATVSLCGTATFNSRVSVFVPLPSCSNPTCVAMSDDAPGCPGGTSEVRFRATAGQTYHIAVHGSGASTGTYTIALFCQPLCTPVVANDNCTGASSLPSSLANGSGIPLLQDNTCAHVDDPTSTSGTQPVVGTWYQFNSGANSRFRLHLQTHAQDAGLSANAISYALYNGTCTSLGSSGEMVSVSSAAGINDLPLLVPGTDYRLLVYNDGSVSQAGSFTVMLDHPGINDAGITNVTGATGLVCGTVLNPEVTLKNFGEATLTSVVIEVRVDGNLVLSHPWTGSLAYNASEAVLLPMVTVPAGLHSCEVSVAAPNGATDEILANNNVASIYDASGHSAKVIIHTDDNGGQITWSIYDVFFFPVATGGPYTGQNNQSIPTTVCLPNTFGDCFSFYLFDSGGDGLCCANGNGFWELHTPDDRVLLRDEFKGAIDGTQSPAIIPASGGYSIGHQICLPGGPASILANECGLMANDLLNKVYCEEVPGALMYQFEFTDPDAGFMRRIAAPRPWVMFGEMVTNPLLPGKSYFTRVRVDQGAGGFADDQFGTGCEMGIDPLAVPGCTQLIDNTALPTHSCGVVKEFGGSDKIWAQPVVGGTLYKFQFTNPGEGYTRTVQSSNYVCVLNWVTQPLVNGSTYTVKVNVLVNGQWSGSCGNACSVTINNPPAAEGRSMEITEAPVPAAAPELVMYPNPVSDGRITIRVANLAEERMEVAFEVVDMAGRTVASERSTHEGGPYEQVLQLENSVSPGTYIVNISLGGYRTARTLLVK